MDAFGFPVQSSTTTKLDQDRRATAFSASSAGFDVDVTAEKQRAASTASVMTTTAATTRMSSSSTTTTTSSTAMPNGNYYNPVVVSFIRDDFIKQQLHLRQSAYTVYQKMSIVTGTWNVNAKKPLLPSEAGKVLAWLQRQGTSSKSSPPDLVALAFQEIVDLNAVNVVVNNLSGQRSSQWEDAILSTLNQHMSDTHQYKTVLSKTLVGILLLVFVRVDHADHVREVYGATAGVGIMGMMGNKGGAAVRLTLYDSTLCFVSAHLAAHRENVAGRNADYVNILSKIDFKENDEPLASGSSVGGGSAGSGGSGSVEYLSGEPPILAHDFVFWLGDLNYRITDDYSTEEVFQLVEAGKLNDLLAKEQLNIERKRGNVFHGFEEGPIKFPPTYKFQAGTSLYERRPEKKLRAPAWCDRVLWKAKIPAHVTQHAYDAVMALDLSDHKPVHAFFDVQIKHQIEAKKNQVLREIMLQFDKWENDNMPRVRLLHAGASANAPATPSNGVLSFSHLKYGLEQTQRLIVENTGIVVAHYRFIPKLEETTISKPWLRVSPAFGMIPPNERVEIHVTARVDETTAHGLTSGDETLDDTMILRIENGRDYFLVVSGQYDMSCFGCSLEQLTACVDPVRHTKLPLSTSTTSSLFQIEQPPPTSPTGSADSSICSSYQQPQQQQQQQRVPKELWRMINDLYTHFMDEKNLFVETSVQANKQEVVVLREALDTGHAFPPHSAHSTAELLLAWLQSLRQSVVTDDALALALAQGNGNVAQTSRVLLDTLSPARHNVLIYIISFLKELLKHANTNKVTPDKLAFVFSRCLVSQYKPGQYRERGGSTSSVSNDSQQPPSSISSTTSTASTASMASMATTGPPSGGSNQLFPEEKLRQTAREAEIAQWNATQRTEKMEKMLLHWLTTNAL